MGRTPTPEAPAEMVADKGYHSREVLKDLEDSAWKSRIAEKERKVSLLSDDGFFVLLCALAEIE